MKQTPRQPAPIAVALAALACATALAQEAPQPRWLLIDPLLESRPVALMEIDNQRLGVHDGELREVAPDEWLALVRDPFDGFANARVSLRAGGGAIGMHERLTLVTGERIFGHVEPPLSGTPDALRWSVPGLWAAPVDLEDVSELRLQRGDELDWPQPMLDDAVVLSNGDILRGFVESIGETVVIELDGRPIDIEPSHVRLIRLANPPREPDTPLVWLSDGSVIGVRALASRGEDRVVLTLREGLGGGPTSANGPIEAVVSTADLAGVLLHPQRLVPLAALELAEAEPGPGRRWAPPPLVQPPQEALLGLGRIELRGPQRLRWTLPQRAHRFAARAAIPHRHRHWGELDLVVAVGRGDARRELARQRLDGDNPVASLTVELPEQSPELEISLDPGDRGPAHDIVVLEFGMVLLAE